jgi:two-component system nitrogen regulation response regulator GlnG
VSGAEVLLAEDDAAIRTVVSRALGGRGYRVRATSSAGGLWEWVTQGLGDVVVTDVRLPDEDALDLLPRLRRLRPELPVIVMSARNTLLTAVRAAESGAFDYLPKPFDIEVLLATVARAVERRREAPAAAVEVEPEEQRLPIIGRSPAMQEVYRIVARLVGTDLTVLITGESGTGKELVARALHDFGRRRGGPFVAVNMAAIPRDLIEAELFGHEKGAFTGAVARRPGRFAQAEGGTLFLDEIGDMPLEAQTRLLRVLQQGEFVPVGGREPIRANVRIVAASHRDLARMVREGLFREDLYYRLNVVPLRLPPLRERPEDIPALVHHFFQRGVAEGLPVKTLTPAAMVRLRTHTWPGNVRELENLVRRLAVLHVEDTIDEAAVEAELRRSAPAVAEAAAAAAETLEAAVARHLDRYFRAQGDSPPPPGIYHRVLHEVERPLIERVLRFTGGNQLRAADILGLNRNTLRKKIRELEIRLPRHG